MFHHQSFQSDTFVLFVDILLLKTSIYIITQVILAFWLVLTYDLLEDRRIDDDSARFNFFEFFEFWILTNHTSLLSLATNQFTSFCIDIRSRQCYFRVCQSGEIWNKKAFLVYKTNRFHVAMCLFSNRSQRTSKCGKNISDTLGCASCASFLFLPHFDIICDLLLNRRTATWWDNHGSWEKPLRAE